MKKGKHDQLHETKYTTYCYMGNSSGLFCYCVYDKLTMNCSSITIIKKYIFFLSTQGMQCDHTKCLFPMNKTNQA